MNILKMILLDERGSTLTVTYAFSPNTLISSTEMNTNFDDVEAVVNALDADNLADDSVGKAELASDVVRGDYGLAQHTDGALQVDPSDTNPCLELSDGGLRVLVDGTTIQRTASGLAVIDSPISDHGGLSGLDDDDHSAIYLNNARHDLVARHGLTVGGTGGESAAEAFTNIVVPKVYDSGWFAVSASPSAITTYAKTHSLGTTNILWTIYVSDSATGASNVFLMGDGFASYDNMNAHGTFITDVTTTTCNVRTYNRIAAVPNIHSPAGNEGWTSGYARIIGLALA